MTCNSIDSNGILLWIKSDFMKEGSMKIWIISYIFYKGINNFLTISLSGTALVYSKVRLLFEILTSVMIGS